MIDFSEEFDPFTVFIVEIRNERFLNIRSWMFVTST